MAKTITIADDAYAILRSLKRGPSDSFSNVIRRHVRLPAKTNAELLEHYQLQSSPDVDWEVLQCVRKERGRPLGKTTLKKYRGSP